MGNMDKELTLLKWVQFADSPAKKKQKMPQKMSARNVCQSLKVQDL